MILQHKAMTTSNCGGFSWTEEKSSIILVISKKLDPLADGTIEMVLSKVVEFKDSTLSRPYHSEYDVSDGGLCLS